MADTRPPLVGGPAAVPALRSLVWAAGIFVVFARSSPRLAVRADRRVQHCQHFSYEIYCPGK
jgi:hypothetical protein